MSPPRMTVVSGLRVLVVDDDDDSREVFAMFLEAQGAIVQQAASVEDALSRLDGFAPDVVLSDLAMPEADGQDLVRAIHARSESGGRHIPTVAVSGYPPSSERGRRLAKGFDEFLGKPINYAQMLEVVARVAGRGSAMTCPAE